MHLGLRDLIWFLFIYSFFGTGFTDGVSSCHGDGMNPEVGFGVVVIGAWVGRAWKMLGINLYYCCSYSNSSPPKENPFNLPPFIPAAAFPDLPFLQTPWTTPTGNGTIMLVFISFCCFFSVFNQYPIKATVCRSQGRQTDRQKRYQGITLLFHSV